MSKRPNKGNRSIHGIREINKFRATMGLDPIRIGKIDCLGCGRSFESDDVRAERLCSSCKLLMKRREEDAYTN